MTDLYYQCTPKTESWLSVKAELDKLNAMITAGWAWGRKHGVPEKAPKPVRSKKKTKGDIDLFDGEEMRGPTRMAHGDTVIGFTRPGRDKTAWRQFEGIWVPNKGTKAGKALAKERAALPQIQDKMTWSTALFKHGLVMGREEGSRGPGMLLRYAVSGCSKKSGRFVAVIKMHTSVKKAAKHWPKGLVEITGSKAAKLVG